jgi:hypothetical protein
MTGTAGAFLLGYALAAVGAGVAIGPWVTVALGVALAAAAMVVADRPLQQEDRDEH